jgi:tRNA-dihydrouridine synthase A
MPAAPPSLSPKENREVPPLDYARVYRLKAARPDLTIVINGGITSLTECDEHLQHVDGVMLGRAAYHEPYILAQVDQRYFGSSAHTVSRREAVERLMPYISQHLARGGRLNNITRHILGFYQGEPRARLFRRILSEEGTGASAREDVLRRALEAVERGPAPVASLAAE